MNQHRTAAVRALQVAVASALLLTGLTLLGGAAGAETTITVETTPAENQGELCDLPDVSSSDTAEAFSVRIVLTGPLCGDQNVHAVAYAMPGNGQAWPQTLIAQQSFTLDRAGTTVVTFSKGCDPVQFDVLTGATPKSINSPLDHGPVLTPGDPNQSALQWMGGGENCGTTTTTTTTEKPPVQPPGTPPPAVQGSTTVPAATATTVRVAAVAVQAATTTPPSSPAATALALTGGRPGSALTVGAFLLAAGLVLSMLARQTRTRRARY
jgi:hypothetical protein